MQNFTGGFVGGFNFMFTVFPIIFIAVFILIIVVFIIILVNSANRYHKNNQSPVLTVDATVVSKRTDVTHYHHGGTMDTMDHMNSSTWYYVTFQVESGDRMELSVTGTDFGILAEGDMGRLTFQGTRFKGFERRY